MAGYDHALGPDHPDTLARCLSLARCERVLPPGDRLTQVLRESLTNVAGASGWPG